MGFLIGEAEVVSQVEEGGEEDSLIDKMTG